MALNHFEKSVTTADNTKFYLVKNYKGVCEDFTKFYRRP